MKLNSEKWKIHLRHHRQKILKKNKNLLKKKKNLIVKKHIFHYFFNNKKI